MLTCMRKKCIHFDDSVETLVAVLVYHQAIKYKTLKAAGFAIVSN